MNAPKGPSRLRIVLVLLGVLLVVGGLGTWLFRREAGPRVDVVHPSRGPLVQTLVTTGRVVQQRQSNLGAVLQTTVAEVLVDEGERVEAGQLLARLADAEPSAAVAEAEAAIEEAEARLRGVRTSGRRLAAEALDAARVDAEQAATEYDRQVRLHETGAVSEAALDRARQTRDLARSRRVSASLQLAQSAPSGSETAVAAAALARAQARLQQARAVFENTRLRAPFAATVLTRDVEPGEVVRPGQVLFVLAGEAPLEVTISPDESNLARLAIDQPALVSPEAFADRRLPAKVARIAPSVDPQRGTIDVTLSLDAPSPDLRPDMTVSVEVELGRTDDAVVLPPHLIRDLATERPWVLVAHDGVARRVDVRLGLHGDTLVEIAEGLDVSASVLSPELDLGEDDPVRIRRASSAEEEHATPENADPVNGVQGALGGG
ncbi:MAG: efflux RND transporter periplasmic adaptor subunit [Sandaracinus sp.]|nr:efflux RND transporter periplasmic adaptor subunit [Sandaracinus sp.]MCB9637131.1 efflux RND transporter periplasmic adaptor subunit [Sandaracinus sp.]